jgi:hypothetical protein
MYRYIAFICVFLFLSGAAVAQKKKPEDPQPNSIDPNYAEEHYVPKTAKRKKKFEVTFEARNEYKDRMEKNWKQREKDEKNFSGERKADKSQPPYFGHKRPPKIRAQGKRKFCKVCGIKH